MYWRESSDGFRAGQQSLTKVIDQAFVVWECKGIDKYERRLECQTEVIKSFKIRLLILSKVSRRE